MITIVTDSTSYITREEAKRLGVKLVPITYNVSGIPFNETYVGGNGNYEKMIKEFGSTCKTSQANISVFLSAFDELLRKGNKVFCLTMSSRLSGTYSSASAAAKQTESEDIIVVDSLTIAGGLLMLIKHARKLFDEGKTMSEVTDEIERMRDKVVIKFSVDDMAPLRRSGRLGIVRQSISTILNIKPILKFEDGSVVSEGIVRGETEQILKLTARMTEDREEAIVHYIDNLKRAVHLAKFIENNKLAKKVVLRKLGPVLGIHLGLGIVGVAWIN